MDWLLDFSCSQPKIFEPLKLYLLLNQLTDDVSLP